MWIKATLAITSNSVPNDYKIQIRADVGSTFHGDTSIDDLKITDGPCEGKPFCVIFLLISLLVLGH